MIRYLMMVSMLCGVSLGGAAYRAADVGGLDGKQMVGGAKLQQAPKPLNLPLLDSVYRGMAVYYDCTAGPYFNAVPEPPRALDDIGFPTTEQVCIGALEFAFYQMATSNLVAEVSFYDTLILNATPVNSDLIGTVEVDLGVVSPGAYLTGLIDITSAFPDGLCMGGGDGQAAVDIVFRDSPGGPLSTTGTPIFAAGTVSLGSNLDMYWRDADGDGQYADPGDRRWFGGPPYPAQFYLKLYGLPEPLAGVEISAPQCTGPGSEITFTVTNNSGQTIYLPHPDSWFIKDQQGNAVYHRPCDMPLVVPVDDGQQATFTWDQTDMGTGTITSCAWDNAAQVPNGLYTFCLDYCGDNGCADTYRTCADFQVGNCVSVTTDQDCYNPGETVTFTITNNGSNLINLRHGGPWEIKDSLNSHVYGPACTTLAVIPLDTGESYSWEWDQKDEGDGQVGCGYLNRAQVANGTYQVEVSYTNENFDPDSVASATFRIADSCVDVEPDCPCHMPGGNVVIRLRNDTPDPIELPHQQPWRVTDLAGAVIFEAPPVGPPEYVVPGEERYYPWAPLDQSGQPVSAGSYNIEIDYRDAGLIDRVAHGRLKLGGCLKLELDQDCYPTGEIVTMTITNTSCEQIPLLLMDRGPIQIVDPADPPGLPIWAVPCVDVQNLDPGDTRTYTWNQTDEGNGLSSDCVTWNNGQAVAAGRYCAEVPYADQNLNNFYTARRCFDIGNNCPNLKADQDCYELGEDVCFTLTNNTNAGITVDRMWRILDSAGNEIHPGPQCEVYWIPLVINAGADSQFCWDQLQCFQAPVAADSYTFEIHFVEDDGTEHTYYEDFTISETPCPGPGITGCGDFSGDGVIDLNDFSTFASCFGLTSPSASCDAGALSACDLNGDGGVDLNDFSTFALRFGSVPGLPPDCIPGQPIVRSDWLCYPAGDTAVVNVDVPPIPAGSLHFLVFEEDGAGQGALLLEETRPLDGSATYQFTVTLPNEVMYNAMARVLDTQGQELGANGLSLGVRPDLPQIPGEICTFEVLTVDASALRSEVETAVAGGTPMPLDIGSRSFLVLLESNADLVAPEILAQEPTLALFTGQVVGDPDSTVAVTFAEGLVHAMVDPSEDPSVYLEPAYDYDTVLPFDMYIGYEGDDVYIPLKDHADPTPPAPLAPPGDAKGSGPSPVELAGTNQERGDGSARHGTLCPDIHVNLYYDNDSNRTRFTHTNNIDATLHKLGSHLYVASVAHLNTNSYHDATGRTNLLGDFASHATTAGADVAMLFTRNRNHINYGNTLGMAWWRRGSYVGAGSAYSWVRRRGSNHRICAVGAHELSHNMGASNTSSGHRNAVRRWTYHWSWWCMCGYAKAHYSLMKSSYVRDDVMDLNWLQADRNTITYTLNNTAGHFCNP
jgi:hypothetical protein